MEEKLFRELDEVEKQKLRDRIEQIEQDIELVSWFITAIDQLNEARETYEETLEQSLVEIELMLNLWYGLEGRSNIIADYLEFGRSIETLVERNFKDISNIGDMAKRVRDSSEKLNQLSEQMKELLG